jgi:CIC family chloride channel protein
MTPAAPPPVDARPPPVRTLRARAEAWTLAALQAFNRVRLPDAAVLPVAGAVVGLYSGLAAGIFGNLISLVRGAVMAPARLLEVLRPGSRAARSLWEEFAAAGWHPEYAVIGVPLALGALLLARLMQPGEGRDEARRRLRVLALLLLGALGLYYPLVALGALNEVFGHSTSLVTVLPALPWWTVVLAPALGGLAVGHLLRNRPETHGHGVPEVVLAVRRGEGRLPARAGLLKLVASSITIGSGGSAGREGPIVFGGAAFASSAGRTLGFARKDLSILLACGAGAGISASFNAPIAGAVFAMEIILRELELKVFSPIILACVTATLVSRGLGDTHAVLRRTSYQLVGGLEILHYVALGLLCGVIAFAFVRLLHGTGGFFSGGHPSALSRWLGRRRLSTRAALGGLLVGGLALVNPSVWGAGHDYMSLAAAGRLPLSFLLAACALKVLATSLTIGSGGSGGTFFPAMMVGAMAGGAYGAVAHELFPLTTAPSGAYAMVGTAGMVAAFTRGPLTGMMMLYELSGNYAIILPLMVTCTIASALCHTLVERRAPRVLGDEELLATTAVREVMLPATPLPPGVRMHALVDLLLTTEQATLPVLDGHGQVEGIVQLDQMREVWRDEALRETLVAADLSRRVTVLSGEADLASALRHMNQEDVDALPVVDARRGGPAYGLVTRAAIRRRLFAARARTHETGSHPVAATEVSR